MFWKAGASTAPSWVSEFAEILLSSTFRVAVAGFTSDRLEGGDGVDVLISLAGSNTLDGGADSDILLGGRGADVLIGGAGRDALWGGRGADLFRFASEDAAQAEADVVVDFSQAHGDRIDLSAFGDVDPWMPGEQGFDFVGDVTGLARPAVYTPGEVTFVHTEDSTLVTANVDGGVLRIQLAGRIDLGLDNFLF